MCPSCRILKTKRIEWRQSVEWTPKISLSGLTRPWRRFLLPTRLNPPTKNSQTGPKFCACSKIFKAFLVFFLTFFLLVVQTKGIRFFFFFFISTFGSCIKTTTCQDATVRHTARIRLEYETNATKSSEATRVVLRFHAIPLRLALATLRNLLLL